VGFSAVLETSRSRAGWGLNSIRIGSWGFPDQDSNCCLWSLLLGHGGGCGRLGAQEGEAADAEQKQKDCTLPEGKGAGFLSGIIARGNGVVAVFNVVGEIELLVESFGVLVAGAGGGVAEFGLGVAKVVPAVGFSLWIADLVGTLNGLLVAVDRILPFSFISTEFGTI
jgi:hypothetical protein